MVVLNELSGERLRSMLAAGHDILECYRVLERGGLNIVSEVLREGGSFYEWNHYPDGDIFDPDSHGQHYYHAHRDEEHGHFHTFLRQPGMPKGSRPVANKSKEKWPRGKDAPSHLIGISMDGYGFPIRLFTTNRWVTGECWYAADDVVAMLDLFVIDHAAPSWPVNRWVSGMMQLFQPQIAELVIERDATIEGWRQQHPERDALEDRELDATSVLDISVDDQVAAVAQALGEG
jgi:hypothetical protein